jgi:hypothetical protein
MAKYKMEDRAVDGRDVSPPVRHLFSGDIARVRSFEDHSHPFYFIGQDRILQSSAVNSRQSVLKPQNLTAMYHFLKYLIAAATSLSLLVATAL